MKNFITYSIKNLNFHPSTCKIHTLSNRPTVEKTPTEGEKRQIERMTFDEIIDNKTYLILEKFGIILRLK